MQEVDTVEICGALKVRGAQGQVWVGGKVPKEGLTQLCKVQAATPLLHEVPLPPQEELQKQGWGTQARGTEYLSLSPFFLSPSCSLWDNPIPGSRGGPRAKAMPRLVEDKVSSTPRKVNGQNYGSWTAVDMRTTEQNGIVMDGRTSWKEK